MADIIKFLEAEGGKGDSLEPLEVLFAMLLCLVCIAIICLVYRFTHKNANYSQSYVQTLILTGLVTSLVMIVIGSNIARAFSLVGALSIIRFRNAIKETRDVGYIYYAMVIAMACGTRFYFLAMMATLFICSVLIMIHLFNFGARKIPVERFLTVQLPPDANPEETLTETLKNLFDEFNIVSMESVRQGLYVEVLLSVRPKEDINGSKVLEEIAKVNNNLKVSYNYGDQNDEF